jgi:dihydrofolate reductase
MQPQPPGASISDVGVTNVLARDARQLTAFIQVSLDGYYCDANGDMNFAHKAPDDVEWSDFVTANAAGGGMLLFGRITYDLMASWWPTPMAAQAMPEVASAMNAMPKMVFSRTLRSAEWSNTTLVQDGLVDTVRRLKSDPGPDIAILGSGTIVQQLAEAGLIDSLQVVVNPVALGAGKSLFAGLAQPLAWTLVKSRVFENGSVVVWYVPQ